jgi:hypothetical protein
MYVLFGTFVTVLAPGERVSSTSTSVHPARAHLLAVSACELQPRKSLRLLLFDIGLELGESF